MSVRKKPAPKPRAKSRSSADWDALAAIEVAALIRRARRTPAVRRLGPAKAWTVLTSLVGSVTMTRLNREYRGKAYPTDVLSFPSPPPFSKSGLLGELILCLPTLRRQARELGHSPEAELRVLLAHGLLHLLGLDHERSAREARAMARLEALLLAGRSPGLIGRSAQA